MRDRAEGHRAGPDRFLPRAGGGVAGHRAVRAPQHRPAVHRCRDLHRDQLLAVEVRGLPAAGPVPAWTHVGRRHRHERRHLRSWSERRRLTRRQPRRGSCAVSAPPRWRGTRARRSP